MVIYTAITGERDDLKPIEPEDSVEYRAFCNQSLSPWISEPNKTFASDNLNAKQYKILPHLFFDTDYSLWVDGNIYFKDSIKDLAEKYLQDCDIAMCQHPHHGRLDEEYSVVRSIGLETPEIIELHKRRAAKVGFQDRGPLHTCYMILRRHTKQIERLNEMWWSQITTGSRRDQLSFEMCAYYLDIKVGYMEPKYERVRHKNE